MYTLSSIYKKKLTIIAAIVGGILMIPLVAMQFTKEVNWGGMDFVIGGSLLFGLGLLFELIIRKVNQSRYRVLLSVVLLLVFLLVWAELAVGIFGTAFAGD